MCSLRPGPSAQPTTPLLYALPALASKAVLNIDNSPWYHNSFVSSRHLPPRGDGGGDFPFWAVSLHLRSKTNLRMCCWSKQANQANTPHSSTPLSPPQTLHTSSSILLCSLIWTCLRQGMSSHKRPILLTLHSSRSCLERALFSRLVPQPYLL